MAVMLGAGVRQHAAAAKRDHLTARLYRALKGRPVRRTCELLEFFKELERGMNAKMTSKTKTQEEARLAHNEYMRKWRKANAEREKEQRLRRMYEEALADLESVEQIGEDVYVLKTKDGCQYVIGGDKQ